MGAAIPLNITVINWLKPIGRVWIPYANGYRVIVIARFAFCPLPRGSSRVLRDDIGLVFQGNVNRLNKRFG
jgi:hypothetical protein